jgi:hypothetical protein
VGVAAGTSLKRWTDAFLSVARAGGRGARDQVAAFAACASDAARLVLVARRRESRTSSHRAAAVLASRWSTYVDRERQRRGVLNTRLYTDVNENRCAFWRGMFSIGVAAQPLRCGVAAPISSAAFSP